jgi:hypothetical protein
MDLITSVLHAIVPDASPSARKLFSVIVRQAEHGPIRFKPPGVATPPEILEACGLDVGEFYELLAMLAARGVIEVSGPYPFEEIRLTPDAQARLDRLQGQQLGTRA